MKAHVISLVFASIYLGACAVLCSPALSQTGPTGRADLDTRPIGKVITASGTVHLAHAAFVVIQANLPPNDAGQTKSGDLVYRGDLIETGFDGALAITFADGTSFNVSRNARIEVNEFIYDPNGQSNSALMSVTKGTFTFIAGNVARTGDMKLDTPLGTIGIRGTTPRIEIMEDGSVKISTLAEQK
jgi:hypothetical protein